ncbi:MAG TPA: hypothetical protein VGB64_01235 [Actinomycetota bacterium]
MIREENLLRSQKNVHTAAAMNGTHLREGKPRERARQNRLAVAIATLLMTSAGTLTAITVREPPVIAPGTIDLQYAMCERTATGQSAGFRAQLEMRIRPGFLSREADRPILALSWPEHGGWNLSEDESQPIARGFYQGADVDSTPGRAAVSWARAEFSTRPLSPQERTAVESYPLSILGGGVGAFKLWYAPQTWHLIWDVHDASTGIIKAALFDPDGRAHLITIPVTCG